MKKILFTGACLLAAAATFNVFADDTIDIDDFVEEASAKGIAEIETAKIALNKGTSSSVKEFAQKMITDHRAANEELAKLARSKKLEVADEAELMNKAKAMILKQRDGESFDVAYANNQVVAHEQTIELFQKASRSKDSEIKAFASKTLPKLEHHLQMARDLVNTTKAAERDANGDKNSATSSYRNNAESSHNSVDGRNTDYGAGTVPPTQYSE